MMDVVSSALRSAGFLDFKTAKMEGPMAGFGVGVFTFAVFLVLCAVLGSFFTVKTAQVAVITRFGKFLRVADPGLNWKWPFIDTVAGRISLRVNQITLTMETKTKDNVFVTIPISVQNRVRPEKAFDAYYKLSNPEAQIQSYVEQVILGHVRA
jgi:regulator of protease activity HflC (stomatin/prohibitin superfamily)